MARPRKKEGSTTIDITEENARELKEKLNLEASVTTTDVAAILAHLLALVKPTSTGSIEGEVTGQTSTARNNHSAEAVRTVTL